MKVKVVYEGRNIPLSEIAEELKKGNIVDRFEYGGYNNWVTAILKEVTVDKVRELGPKAINKYCVTVKSVWNYIGYDGTVSEEENIGYFTLYTDDLNSLSINVYGYAIEE